MKLYFLKYKSRQIALYYIKVIVNLLIYEKGVPIHFIFKMYHRSSPINDVNWICYHKYVFATFLFLCFDYVYFGDISTWYSSITKKYV